MNAADPRAFPKPFRVVVADPHAATREAIAQVLAGDGFELVGTADTMGEAIELIREASPDVLVVDPWLFGPAGLPGCLVAKRLHPRLLIVALFPEERDEYPRAAQAMGVDATVAKQRVGRDLIPAMVAALGIDRR